MLTILAYVPAYGSRFSCNQKAVYNNTNGTIEYCYIQDVDGSLTWSHAQGVCQSLNYTLAVLDTMDEQTFINNSTGNFKLQMFVEKKFLVTYILQII